jgi:peptidoglycan hydrolase CwlO-like protein
MNTETNTINYNRYLLAFGIILVVAIIGIIVSIVLTFARTGSDEETISTLRGEVAALESQLSTAQTKLDSLAVQVVGAEGRVASISEQRNSDVAALQGELTAATDQIASLGSQISSVLSQLSGLQAEVISDDSQISSIEAQLASLNTQLSSVSSTAASLQTKLTSLEKTVTTLSGIVNRLNYPLANPVALFISRSVNQSAGAQTLLYTFTATYNGYVYITGNSNSTTGYIRIVDNSTTASQTYAFGTSNTLTIPLTAGHNYSIYFGNTAASGTVSAVLSGTYYY